MIDDEPAPVRDWLPGYAEVLGARPPTRVATVLGGLLGGRIAVYLSTMQRGASNALLRGVGGRPRYPSWRTGFLEAMG